MASQDTLSQPKRIDRLHSAAMWSAGPIDAEYPDKYGPGKFRPVYLGDTFKEGRYKVENKLGYGACSTIWSARDTETNTVVALKVLTGEASKEGTELRVMLHLKNTNHDHPGRKYVSELLDHFYEDYVFPKTGIKDHHVVLVMGVAGFHLYDYTRMLRNVLQGPQCRLVCRQMLLAVDFLHACDIVHGDLHSLNVMFRWPDETFDFGEPHKGPLISRRFEDKDINEELLGRVKEIEDSMPDYLVEPVRLVPVLRRKNLFDEHFKRPLDIQIVDFSSAFFDTDPELPKSVRSLPAFRPPESIFKLPLTRAIDIWAIGCMASYAATGLEIFGDFQHDPRDLIRDLHATFGDKSNSHWLLGSILDAIEEDTWPTSPRPLEKWRDFSTIEAFVHDELYRLDEDPTRDPDRKLLKDMPSVKKFEEMFVHYLRRIFVADPKERPTAKELLSEEFVQEIPLEEYSISEIPKRTVYCDRLPLHKN